VIAERGHVVLVEPDAVGDREMRTEHTVALRCAIRLPCYRVLHDRILDRSWALGFLPAQAVPNNEIVPVQELRRGRRG